ncbi:MAG TPA: formyltransferase family protein, partial [Thermoleophilia bacterium]|nr:formyltransferase family protein [Thermoleophilia bacterium]
MRVAFAGTAPFADVVLRGLFDSPYEPVVVVTNPDRPRGRRGTPQPPVVKVTALERGLSVLQPERLSDPVALDELLNHTPDVFVACAYGQIVGRAVLEALPCLVVHPSLVPRWRGAAPVERALMAGETELGVTVLRMTAGVDEGPVAETRVVRVSREADAGEAYAALAPAAVEALQATLAAVEAGTVGWEEQRGEPTYAPKIAPEDRVIVWTNGAREIVDRVRALAPHIGAVTELLGERTRIWRAVPVPSSAEATAGAAPEAGSAGAPPGVARDGVSAGAPPAGTSPGAPFVIGGDRLLFGAGDGAVEVLE